MAAVILAERTQCVHDAVDHDPSILDHAVALDLVPANQSRVVHIVIQIRGGWSVRNTASARGAQVVYDPVEPPSRASRARHMSVYEEIRASATYARVLRWYGSRHLPARDPVAVRAYADRVVRAYRTSNQTARDPPDESTGS